MSVSRISANRQVGFLYLLAIIWNTIWIVALVHSKAFLAGLPLVFDILFFLIPILYFYALFRVASDERAFISKHPIVFAGSIGLAVVPPIAFFACIIL